MIHAFLIMAHANWELLAILLKKLDRKNHLLYVHIDAKSNFSQEDQLFLSEKIQNAKLFFVRRYPVYWGGYSLINCELRLFEAALEHKADYFHLISGNDFPIKSWEKFNDFFLLHKGLEFVDFAGEDFNQSIRFRYNFYYLFQDCAGRKKGFLYYLGRVIVSLQKILPFIQRAKRAEHLLKKKYSVEYERVVGEKIKGGSEWVSITPAFAHFLLSQEKMIKRLFSRTFCCDEVYKQTFMCYSDFYSRCFQVVYPDCSLNQDCNGSLRSIDWKRGQPYIFTIDDMATLQSSKAFFCRKVGLKNDQQRELVEALTNMEDH